MNNGYSFIWKAGETPILIRPDGVGVELEVRGYIPYITASSVVRSLETNDVSIDVYGLRKQYQDNSCLLLATSHPHSAVEDASDSESSSSSSSASSSSSSDSTAQPTLAEPSSLPPPAVEPSIEAVHDSEAVHDTS